MDIHFYHHIGAETLEFLQKTGVPAITNRLDNIQEILKIMNAKQDEFDAQLAEIKAGQQEGTDLVVNLGTIVHDRIRANPRDYHTLGNHYRRNHGGDERTRRGESRYCPTQRKSRGGRRGNRRNLHADGKRRSGIIRQLTCAV